MNKCFGCGCDLQTENKEKLGYVAPAALEKGKHLCMRCFNITNYNKNIAKDYTDEQFVDILKKISSDNLIVMVVDVFDLNSTLLPTIIKEIREHDVLLFVNKIDMLPTDVNIDKLLMNIIAMYQNLKLKIINGALISAKNKFNIDYAKELIDNYSNGRDVYIVGVSNVGKSQFIKAFLEENEITDSQITVSHFPATTIDVLKFEYEDIFIYDTPGIINRSQIIHYIPESDIKYLYPKRIKQKVFQLKQGSTLLIAGYLRIDINSGIKTSLTLFCSDLLNVHRRKTEGCEEFIAQHFDDLLVHGYIDNDLKSRDLQLNRGEEVAINGLCWFKVNEDVDITVTVHKEVGVNVREKLL